MGVLCGNGLMMEGLLKLFTKRQNSRLVQIQSPCRRQNKCDSKFEYFGGKGRKHFGQRRKCWLPAFSPFPKMFSKASFLRVIKSQDCVEKINFYVCIVTSLAHYPASK